MTINTRVSTCLWFADQAKQAAELYVSLIPNSEIVNINQFKDVRDGKEEDKVVLVNFQLDGVPYQALNGGPMFQLNEAASIVVITEDQAETDKLWNALTADGGSESQCGWLKDRFGLSWQIIPKRFLELMRSKNSNLVLQALHKMTKIQIAELEAVANSN